LPLRLRHLLSITLCLCAVALDTARALPAETLALRSVRGRGVTLHYVEAGLGEPVVMVHGGLEDYRAWTAQLAPLAAANYRAIAYSRRYNFPNRNPTRDAASYSARVDADDLAMLIEQLHLGPVHLVGHSYGAVGALLFATERPELVRTLTLSEPPVMSWVEEQPGGAALVQEFFGRCWLPLGRAFAQGRHEEALAIAMKYFTGSPVVSPEARAALEPSLQEWEVLTASRKGFPVPSAKAIAGVRAPVLLLTGDHTLPLLKRCVTAVAARFPQSRRVTIRNATHDMWSEKPDVCGAALRKFLRETSAR
jgi:non-heme chloroperoxidase